MYLTIGKYIRGMRSTCICIIVGNCASLGNFEYISEIQFTQGIASFRPEGDISFDHDHINT